MAVGAASDISLRIVCRTQLSDRMTRRADTGLGRLQQILSGRTMGRMTEATILDDREMFVDPGARLRLVTTLTLFVLGAQISFDRAMGGMTVGAVEHAFPNGMMGRKIQSGRHRGVTVYAELRRGCRIRQHRRR